MLKSHKKILSGLRSIAGNSEDILCFLGGTDCICLFDDYNVTYDYSKYKKEIHSIIRYLAGNGYLEYVSSEFGNEQFTITQKGMHPYQIGWEALKRFLFTSVAVPIVVSAITALITLTIKGSL